MSSPQVTEPPQISWRMRASGQRPQGLKVEAVSPAATRINVSGFVPDLQNAFGVSLHAFQVQGKSYVAATASPSLPAATAGMFAAIDGLNQIPGPTMSFSGSATSFPALADLVDAKQHADRPAGLGAVRAGSCREPVGGVHGALCAGRRTGHHDPGDTLLRERRLSFGAGRGDRLGTSRRTRGAGRLADRTAQLAGRAGAAGRQLSPHAGPYRAEPRGAGCDAADDRGFEQPPGKYQPHPL